MRVSVIPGLALAVLAACAGPSRLGDARAQALLALPAPQFFAEMRVAQDLVDACPRYGWDARLERELMAARGAGPAGLFGAIALESDVRKRSLAARYGAGFAGPGACDALAGEIAQASALSVMATGGG